MELQQKRNGYSLADCAEIMAQHSDLKRKFGEPGFQNPWQQYLGTKGLSENQWAHVWNDWWKTLQGDPNLAAKYHTYHSQVMQKQMMAGQPNVSQDALHGVTLEQFAKIGAKIQGGGNPEQLVAAEGLSMAQWQQGQAAWGQKMGTISPTDPIMMQYGQLYQKYNSTIPTVGGGSATAEQVTANILDKDLQIYGNRGIDVTLANAESEFFASPIVRHKARGVREVLNMWDRAQSDRRMSDTALQRATARAVEIAIDLLKNGPGSAPGPGVGPGYEAVRGSCDPMDIHQWSDTHKAEESHEDVVQTVQGPLKDVAAAEFMTPAQNEAAKAAFAAAIARLTPRRDRAEELFNGTRDVTKQTSLRSLLDGYNSLLGDLQDALNDWTFEPAPSAAGAASAPSGGASFGGGSPGFSAPPANNAMTVQKPSSPFIAFLRGLPIIGSILKALGIK